MIVLNMVLLPETEEDILAVTLSRQTKTSKPYGERTPRGIWLPYPIEACECCSAVRMPSSKWAWTLYNHCRTPKHVRMLAEKAQRLAAPKTSKRYERAMARLAREDLDAYERRLAKSQVTLRENALAEFERLGQTMDARHLEQERLKTAARTAYEQYTAVYTTYNDLCNQYSRRYGLHPLADPVTLQLPGF